jgi:hypothetical protein
MISLTGVSCAATLAMARQVISGLFLVGITQLIRMARGGSFCLPGDGVLPKFQHNT